MIAIGGLCAIGGGMKRGSLLKSLGGCNPLPNPIGFSPAHPKGSRFGPGRGHFDVVAVNSNLPREILFWF